MEKYPTSLTGLSSIIENNLVQNREDVQSFWPNAHKSCEKYKISLQLITYNFVDTFTLKQFPFSYTNQSKPG